MSPSACRVCLVIGDRMHQIEDLSLLGLYEKLSNTKLTGDGWPHTLCYMCAAQLQRCARFATEVHRAEKFLKELLQDNKEVTIDKVASWNIEISQHLSLNTLKSTSFDGYCIDGTPTNSETADEVIVEQEGSITSEHNTTSLEVNELDIKEKNSIETHSCNICQYRFMSKSDLDNHIKTHTDSIEKGDTLCQICNKSFANYKSLKQHYSIHTGSKPFVCNQCDAAFRLKVSLRHHIVVHHSKVKRFACDACNKSYFLKKNFTVHKQSPKCQQRVLPSPFDHYSCDLCNKKFRNKGNLRSHLRAHSVVRFYKCETCGKGFNQRSNLRAHLKIHFEEKLFSCEICGKAFLRKCSLLGHLQTHMKIKPYGCDRCEMRFTFKISLIQHLKKIHADAKAFPCSICGKSFDEKSDLTKHVSKHAAERNHSCHICFKTYKTTERLNCHIKTHSMETPFVCVRCNKAFKLMRYLRQHLKSKICRAVSPSDSLLDE